MSALTLDPDTVSALVQKAIIDSLSDEHRDKLIADAIQNLIAVPPRDRYGSPGKPLLQQAFDAAVQSAAYTVVRDAFAEDPKVTDAVRAVVHPLVADLCEGNYDGLPEAVGAAFASWLQNRH